MKQKIKIELVYKKKEKNAEGETCYSGYVSLNGQRLEFLNRSYEGMLNTFERNTKRYINEVLRKEEIESKRYCDVCKCLVTPLYYKEHLICNRCGSVIDTEVKIEE